MHSSRAGAAPAALAAGAVAAGVAAGAVAAAAAGSTEQQAAAEEAQPGAVDVAARRPGFRLDVNDLAEDSVSGEGWFVGVCAACWEGAVVVWPRALCLSGEAVVCVRETACWLAAQAPRWHAWVRVLLLAGSQLASQHTLVSNCLLCPSFAPRSD